MSTHNMFLKRKTENNIAKAFNMLLIKSSADLSLKSALIRLIFYYNFAQ